MNITKKVKLEKAMNKKILVLGGCGYIGGLTCDTLLKNGFYVTVYDNLLYEERFLKNINFIYGDIRESSKIAEISNNFDVIVIMAALVGDPACSVNQNLTNEINFEAIKNLCQEIPPEKHVIFMSTCSVYGAQDGDLNEESPTNPLSSYASTKLMSEEFVLKRGGTIFRLGTVFGLGDDFSRIRMDLVVNILTMRAIKNGEISINGGDQWRPIISVIDIAEYVSEACEFEYEGVFVLAKENVIIRELGERVAKLIPNTKINYTEISFQDARNYKIDNNKSLKTFKYKPKVSVEDEVKRMVKMFDENRIKNPEDIVYNNGKYLNIKQKINMFK
jgi:nucleoside-diphosphate-sugar epimerase